MNTVTVTLLSCVSVVTIGEYSVFLGRRKVAMHSIYFLTISCDPTVHFFVTFIHQIIFGVAKVSREGQNPALQS